MAENRLQILFLIPSLCGGGAERVIVNLLRHLDRVKFRLALALLDKNGAVFLDDVPEDVEIIDLGCPRVRYALPKIARLIWQRQPDIVFSTLGHLNLALAIIRPLLPSRVRYVARETSIVSEIIRGYLRPSFWKFAYRRFYGQFDTVICQSSYMRNDLVSNFGLPQHKAVIIHNPVDVERIRRLAVEPLVTGYERANGADTDAPIHLVAAGRLSHEKGFDLLIDAFALCGNPRLRLTILGEGPLYSELVRLVLEKGVASQVRIVGFQKNPFPFLSQADAFVMSSRYEGFPNVVLEALACGTPVIATPSIGGVREILEGVVGCVLAECVTAAGLAKVIDDWGNGEHTTIEADSVSRFLIQKIVCQYESVFLNNYA